MPNIPNEIVGVQSRSDCTTHTKSYANANTDPGIQPLIPGGGNLTITNAEALSLANRGWLSGVDSGTSGAGDTTSG